MERHWYRQTFCLICHKSVDFLHGTIESHDIEFLMIGNIQEQILAHNGQTDEAKIATRSASRRSADIDAGQTGATVSPESSSTWFIVAKECHDYCISKDTSGRERLLWWYVGWVKAGQGG